MGTDNLIRLSLTHLFNIQKLKKIYNILYQRLLELKVCKNLFCHIPNTAVSLDRIQ